MHPSQTQGASSLLSATNEEVERVRVYCLNLDGSQRAEYRRCRNDMARRLRCPPNVRPSLGDRMQQPALQ
jgi:hypothetical protein